MEVKTVNKSNNQLKQGTDLLTGWNSKQIDNRLQQYTDLRLVTTVNISKDWIKSEQIEIAQIFDPRKNVYFMPSKELL